MDTPGTLNKRCVYTFGARRYDLSARTHVMGVLNVTPDSFSDGGRYFTTDAAVAHAMEMIEHGADFIDVGGESTRPKGLAYGEGADPVSEDEELRRVIPVVERLASATDVPVSIDTYKSGVAGRALAAGAVIVNDISGFGFDPRLPEVVARAGASAIVMHIKGTPKTMQIDPVYDDLPGEVMGYLEAAIARGREAGIDQLIIDPGIGFGKRLVDNLQLIRGLDQLASLGYPVLVGPSRKAFIGSLLNLSPSERLEGTLAACVAAILYGAHIIRVHDVKQVKRAAIVADAIRTSLDTSSLHH
jgi:dihydropteroate synthase